MSNGNDSYTVTDDLREAVVTLLVVSHDFEAEEAEEAVAASIEKDIAMWNENAVADDLAKYLATEED